MAFDAVAHNGPKKRRHDLKDDRDQTNSVEVEIGGRKVRASKQTVPTGAGSISRFFSRLLD
jgi:hypothetical protein